MQMQLKCAGKVTKTLKMAKDIRQVPTEGKKITVVLFSIARNGNDLTQVLKYQGLTKKLPKSWRKCIKLSLWSVGSLSTGTCYQGKILQIDHSMLILWTLLLVKRCSKPYNYFIFWSLGFDVMWMQSPSKIMTTHVPLHWSNLVLDCSLCCQNLCVWADARFPQSWCTKGKR